MSVGHRKARPVRERGVLIEAALAATGEYEHPQVHLREPSPFTLPGSGLLDDDNPSTVTNSLRTPGQDRGRLLIAPVVQHAVEHVQVPIGGQYVEETLPHERAAPIQATSDQTLLAALDRLGQIDQSRAQSRVRLHDGG